MNRSTAQSYITIILLAWCSAVFACGCRPSENNKEKEGALRDELVADSAAHLAKITKYLELLKNGETNTLISAMATDLDVHIIRVANNANTKSIESILAISLEFRRKNQWLRRYMTAGDEIHATADKVMNQ